MMVLVWQADWKVSSGFHEVGSNGITISTFSDGFGCLLAQRRTCTCPASSNCSARS